jgi:3-methylfumaryl-CoA hydratase
VPLRVGDEISRQSRIADVSMKEGRSGSLCFVVLEHAINVSGNVCVEERQSLVFREANSELAPVVSSDGAPSGRLTEAMAGVNPIVVPVFESISYWRRHVRRPQ